MKAMRTAPWTLTVAAATLLQTNTSNAVMGRVAAGYDMIGTVPTTMSIALGAVLVGLWPYQLILALSAVGCAAAALVMQLRSPSRAGQPATREALAVSQEGG